jgi:hypothetical protein
MSVEELLKMLREGGLDDMAIKDLLSDALASLKGPEEEDKEKEMHEEEGKLDEERAKAGELLGVTL